jgi:tetratricopeptide (TPR) repeat protein
MSAKIALTYIVKDNSELSLFQNSLKSFMPYFDGLFVVVNGLSKQHEKIHQEVKKWKGKSISISPETHPHVYNQKEDGTWEFVNFAGARQASFDLVTSDFEYISWADTDDLLQGGTEIRNIVQAAKQQGIDMVYCTYYYSCIFNKDGSVKEPVIFHERERIIKNSPEFKWDKWLHEVCIPKDKPVTAFKMQKHSYNPKNGVNLLWVHTADINKSTQALMRNVHILELQAKYEEYKDPRTILYIAKTYFDIGGEDKLIQADKYLDMYLPMSGWDEEIAVAYHYKGLIRQRLGRDKEAVPFYKEAIKVYPKNHIDYLRLTDALFKLGDFESGSLYLAQAAVLPEMESKATIGNPFEVKILFLTLKYQEAQQKGDLNGMEEYAKLRSEYVKDALLEDVTRTKELNDVAKGIYNYAIYLLKNQPQHLEDLILTIKKPFIDENFVLQLSNSKPIKEWKDNEIVYYASFGQKHFEEWTAKNLESGIGGSESAVIYLSKEWVKQGYRVVVYCDCGNDAGIYDGVEYRHYNTINFKDKFSTIIFWRSPHLLDIPFLEAKRIFMDLHDIADMTHWTPERVKKVDKVFFKSKWHRRNLPNIPNDKAVIISNGINL